jgi:NADH:ubiquinone oxidoreductase subunit 5 (subunit L)/multisubunit Na+/H+ antiporter MnhA subunit
MYILVVFLPLLSAIIAGLFGRKIGIQGAKRLTTIIIFITCAIA